MIYSPIVFDRLMAQNHRVEQIRKCFNNQLQAIEVTSEPLVIQDVMGAGVFIGIYLFLAFLFLLIIGTPLAVAVGHHCFRCIGLCEAAFLPLIIIFAIWDERNERASNAQPRLSRFLECFTRIETLVIDKDKDEGGIDLFLPHLGDVRVHNLEVRGWECEKSMQ